MSAREAGTAFDSQAYEQGAHWPERLEDIRRDPAWERAYSDPEPLVTVRIATWNSAETLCERALASVLAQTYPHWEAIVVGDACTDDTAERIAGIGDPRIHFHNRAFRGPYPEDPQQRWLVAGIPGMNLGAELASGTWIAPLDHDDEWERDHLEILLDAAIAERAEVAYGRLRGLVHDPQLETIVGTWPPRRGDFGFQGAIYNAALKELRYDPACRFYGEPGDWNLARRMWEAGVRFSFVDRIVATWHNDTADPELERWFRARSENG